MFFRYVEDGTHLLHLPVFFKIPTKKRMSEGGEMISLLNASKKTKKGARSLQMLKMETSSPSFIFFWKTKKKWKWWGEELLLICSNKTEKEEGKKMERKMEDAYLSESWKNSTQKGPFFCFDSLSSSYWVDSERKREIPLLLNIEKNLDWSKQPAWPKRLSRPPFRVLSMGKRLEQGLMVLSSCGRFLLKWDATDEMSWRSLL